MLLTLSASCLKSLVLPAGRGKKPQLDLLELPAFTKGTLGLGGMNLSTDLLVGADRARLDIVRERTDKAGCSCLLLVEADSQKFGDKSAAVAAAATERMRRVVEAAHILGCSAAAVRITAEDDDESLATVAQRLKPVVERAERLDLNLLISPGPGLTSRPERVTELLKKIGGFRIGTFPDFQTASSAKDPAAYLHRITPYATVVSASTVKLVSQGARKARKGEAPPPDEFAHEPYSLKTMVDAIAAVGYDGPLAIDYRGEGDPVAGVAASRLALLSALGEHPADLAREEDELAGEEEVGEEVEEAGEDEA
ncbi:MAG: sugar phosphate isomerase/epimerase family protein [Phycisphaerales bacterium]